MRPFLPSLVTTALALAACPVDLPRQSELELACQVEEDCITGYSCVQDRCLRDGQDAGLVSVDADLADAAARDLVGRDGADMDAAVADAAVADAAVADAAISDAAIMDAGAADGGTTDAGMTDAGMTDAGTADGGTTDAGMTDAGMTDAGTTDAGTTDAGAMDAAVADAGSDWLAPGWGQRVALYFDNSASSSDLVDFPVLVRLETPGFDPTAVSASGADLRFTPSGSHDLLPHEVTRADDLAVEVWVRAPLIPAGATDTYLWLYYDNPSAPAREDPPAVWSNGYVGVWHLDEEPVGDGAVRDSLEQHHGTAAGGMSTDDLVAGVIEGALDFDGSDDTVDVGDLATDAWTALTIEAWLRQDAVGADPRLICKAENTGGSGHVFCLLAQGNHLDGRINTEGSGYSSFSSSNNLSTGTWGHAAMTWSQTTARLELFINGVPAGGINKSGTSLRDSAQHVHLGNNNATDPRWYDGLMDEVRISSMARSADWLRAQHLGMTGAFVTIGVAESR